MISQKVPYLTADTIIEYAGGIVLIERKFPPLGWALPGGFVDYGEKVEVAAIREAKEETNLDLEDVKFFTLRSNPKRDKRFHIVTCVFAGKGKPVVLKPIFSKLTSSNLKSFW